MNLSAVDITLFSISLITSAAIGIYYGVRGLQSTPLEYLLGGRSMKPFPLAMSMVVGTVSAVTIMGNAGEMYAYGTQLWVMDLGIAVGMLVVAKALIPIMYPLQMVSLYQYIERRFKSKSLRQGTVVLQLFCGYFFIGFLLYPPSIALKYFTGLPIMINIFIMGATCTVYSAFGGVKAVVYADVFQALVMVIGVLAIVIQGSLKMGGLDKIWDIAYHGDRIEFFNFSLSPYQRHSFWLCLTLGLFFALSTYGVNQSQTQRFFSTGSVKQAQCSVSTQLNSMTALLWEDFLKEVRIFSEYSEVKKGLIQKILVLISGVIGLAFGLAVSQMGSFFRTLLAINGALTGPLIGLFLVAVYFPWINAAGAAFGFVISIILNLWIVFGQLFTQLPSKYLVLSREECPSPPSPLNVTTIAHLDLTTTAAELVNITTTTEPALMDDEEHSDGDLYGLSYCLNSVWGTLICMVIAVIVTAVTGTNGLDDIDKKLVDAKSWALFERTTVLQGREPLVKSVLRRSSTSQRSNSCNKGDTENPSALELSSDGVGGQKVKNAEDDD
ncbi:sodium-dependent multivitamin transporter-like isoform X3 [Macrobrachium rosenbergii]|uniref:sodium-dependent multivitamin transporter-like isoform X3 n=1 Tax=Macrobrachium rosenbergii TaxID=79674 RepID=UPI0034D68E18